MTRKLYLVIIALAFSGAGAGYGQEHARIARLSYVDGHVSFMRPSEVDWTPALSNLPLQPGDRVYTGSDGRTEIEFDEGSVLRLAERTDVELVTLADDRIGFRILTGLCTLTAKGTVSFQVSTTAASFTTQRDGVYRFDVTETGSIDGIVRKGRMAASGQDFSEFLDAGELMHVEAGDRGTHLLSRYADRDEWDEWTDRRSADAMAYESRKYLPDDVYYGASDLDRYGRWISVDPYGWGWIPHSIGPGWSPYWDGRWCYRPFWGWTWLSYEPWGWLPYHYGRWHFSASTGWCWLPGPSVGFHFWSPGLVRFYHGPASVSWVPLGPGDYYNVYNYHYSPRYSHHLNSMRLAQYRSPENLANRHIPGAFRTAPTDEFVNGRPGRRDHLTPVAEVSWPSSAGRMVTDRLDVAPTPLSFMPVVGRQAESPVGRTHVTARGVITSPPALGLEVGAPAEGARNDAGLLRSDRSEPGNPASDGGSSRRSPLTVMPDVEQGTRIWNRIFNDQPHGGTGPSPSSDGEVQSANPRAMARGVPGTPGVPGNEASSVSNGTVPLPVMIERRSWGGEPRRVVAGSRPDSAGPAVDRRAMPGPQPSPRPPLADPGSGMERTPTVPGRRQSFGGGSGPTFSQPSWQNRGGPLAGAGTTSVTRQSPSGGRGASPGPSHGEAPRNAGPGGGAGILRGRRN